MTTIGTPPKRVEGFPAAEGSPGTDEFPQADIDDAEARTDLDPQTTTPNTEDKDAAIDPNEAIDDAFTAELDADLMGTAGTRDTTRVAQNDTPLRTRGLQRQGRTGSDTVTTTPTPDRALATVTGATTTNTPPKQDTPRTESGPPAITTGANLGGEGGLAARVHGFFDGLKGKKAKEEGSADVATSTQHNMYMKNDGQGHLTIGRDRAETDAHGNIAAGTSEAIIFQGSPSEIMSQVSAMTEEQFVSAVGGDRKYAMQTLSYLADTVPGFADQLQDPGLRTSFVSYLLKDSDWERPSNQASQENLAAVDAKLLSHLTQKRHEQFLAITRPFANPNGESQAVARNIKLPKK